MGSTPFRFQTRAHEFEKALTRLVASQLKAIRDQVIPVENTQRFSHGRMWQTAPGGADDKGEIQAHSFESSTRFDDIVGQRLEILNDFLREVVDEMHRQFMQSLYGTMDQVTAKTGNVVKTGDHASPADAFLAMLGKIEFGVDANGNVSLPQVHLGSEAHRQLIASIEAKGEEFKKEVERLTAEKSAAALERERERLSKFLSVGDEG